MAGVAGFDTDNSYTSFIAATQALLANTKSAVAKFNISASSDAVNVSVGSSVGVSAGVQQSINDIISLSAEAKNHLATQQSASSNSSSQQSTAPSTSASLTSTETGVMQQAQNTILSNPTTAFYSWVNDVGGPSKYITSLTNSQSDQNAFIKAWNSGNIQVQSAVDVPGLDYQDNSTITATSEIMSVSYNTAWFDAQNTSSTEGNQMIMLPGVGGLYATWPKN